MPNEQVTIRTRDGECTLQVGMPAADGPLPAVIFYMDAGGIRSAVSEMAQRLAGGGDVVLPPDLFCRYGPYGPFMPREVFAGDSRAFLGPLMDTIGNYKAAEETEVFLASVDAATSLTAWSARRASAWAAAWHSPQREPIRIASRRS